jgi:hypothetical protein
VGHQLRRDPNHPLAGAEQITLQATREMPAVLDRPLPLLAVLLGPAQQRQMIGRRRSQRLRAQLAAVFVDRDDGVAALVGVDPQYDHVFRLLAAAGGSDRSVGISQYGAVPRSSEATPAGPSASDGPHNEPVPPRRGKQIVERTRRTHPA